MRKRAKKKISSLDYVRLEMSHLYSKDLTRSEASRLRKVHKLPPEKRFFYWILERHDVYIKSKIQKLPAPWTVDPILKKEFFTNPLRENDRVTVWFRDNIRDPLDNAKTQKIIDSVLFATVLFRWFNKPEPTGSFLRGKNPKRSLLTQWDEKVACEGIQKLSDDGKNPVFTGAYMIKAGNGPKGCKIPNVCSAITNVWKDRQRLIEVAKAKKTMEALHTELVKFPFLGGFMAYEIVCDLRYTKIFGGNPPKDRNTWSNLGPGAARGLMRMSGQKIVVPKSGMKDARPKPPADWMKRFQDLMNTFNDEIRPNTDLPLLPKFEMREIEHSLCEWDKYERMLQGDATRTKRKYKKGV